MRRWGAHTLFPLVGTCRARQTALSTTLKGAKEKKAQSGGPLPCASRGPCTNCAIGRQPFGGGRGDGRLVALRLCETINTHPRGHIRLCIFTPATVGPTFFWVPTAPFFLSFLCPCLSWRALLFFPLFFYWHLAGGSQNARPPTAENEIRGILDAVRRGLWHFSFCFVVRTRAATAAALPDSFYGRTGVHAAACAHHRSVASLGQRSRRTCARLCVCVSTFSLALQEPSLTAPFFFFFPCHPDRCRPHRQPTDSKKRTNVP
ncbi:hypothetical protein pdul_cds_991 [Pandoravirus dulcis]|uniref:Uncharacterized protein n=1 Tax=Pandoravirus dulcis TaxID=1349409 RepID=A0A291AUF8_9VIRU|nr:hypothetical protein pdul_cds_991 [Pandoravirus dulcis]ATE82576.1 hypothetical protein pdul_cds_991 [Pandoravirus dulcis]